MKFLVDAQLPRCLAHWLQQRGHDVLHTFDLTQQNRTPDLSILNLVNEELRVLITKDTDFEISHELGKGPPKLLLITTGNIHNKELLEIFAGQEATLCNLLNQHTFIELNSNQIIVHK